LLIRRQSRGGRVAVIECPQHRAVVARVDQIKESGFFGQDGREGESLVAFALMRGPRRGQPDPEVVDRGLHNCTRRLCKVDG